MQPLEDRPEEERLVIDALLKHNYLPAQKGPGEELPPIFNSKSFTLPAAQALADMSLRKNGYDSLYYGMSRPAQADRAISIPHPLPYSHTVLQIASNWGEIGRITYNKHSHIKPNFEDDGRILVMNYHDQPLEQLERELDASLGKSFRVQADIRKCYSNIPLNFFSRIDSEPEFLMLDGVKPSLRNRWFYKLERCLSLGNCNKTSGLPVGPASSNIVAEFLLFYIDDALRQKGFSFDRYIDDYVCYCDTHDEAERFLDELRNVLGRYGLELNKNKTFISALPQTLSPVWLIDLQAALPVKKHDKYYFSLTEALRYLDYSLRLQKQFPDKSVMKFAVKSIISHIDEYHKERVYQYVLNLSRQYPSLLPLLTDLLSYSRGLAQSDRIEELLRIIISDSARNRSSDGMVWGLYYLMELNGEPGDALITAIQRTRDPMALVCLQAYKLGTHDTLSLLMNLSDEGDLWAIDRYWMLFYQFYLEEIIPNPYPKDNVFEVLRYYDVNFVDARGSKVT